MKTSGTSGILAYIFLAIDLISLVYVYFINKNSNKEMNKYLILTSIGTMFSLLAKNVSLFGRIAIIFNYYFMLYIPLLFDRYFKNSNKVTIYIIIYILLGIAVIVSSRGYAYNVY